MIENVQVGSLRGFFKTSTNEDRKEKVESSEMNLAVGRPSFFCEEKEKGIKYDREGGREGGRQKEGKENEKEKEGKNKGFARTSFYYFFGHCYSFSSVSER